MSTPTTKYDPSILPDEHYWMPNYWKWEPHSPPPADTRAAKLLQGVECYYQLTFPVIRARAKRRDTLRPAAAFHGYFPARDVSVGVVCFLDDFPLVHQVSQTYGTPETKNAHPALFSEVMSQHITRLRMIGRVDIRATLSEVEMYGIDESHLTDDGYYWVGGEI